MKKATKITSVTVVLASILLVIMNQFFWTWSYSYACWRVAHPFGPDVHAFARVVGMTKPTHIPYLIANVEEPDGWWIESMLKAWFPEARPPEVNKHTYWAQWLEDHHLKHGPSLILHHDPKF